MKTYGEIIKEKLPPHIAEKAIRYMKELNKSDMSIRLTDESVSVMSLLLISFSWHKTSEGHAYWSNVAAKNN